MSEPTLSVCTVIDKDIVITEPIEDGLYEYIHMIHEKYANYDLEMFLIIHIPERQSECLPEEIYHVRLTKNKQDDD